MEFQKELAKGWSKDNSVPIETEIGPMEAIVEPTDHSVMLCVYRLFGAFIHVI